MSDQRIKTGQNSDEAGLSCSSSFRQAAEAALELELNLTPQETLQRYLSLRSIVSTSSSFAESHQAAVGAGSLALYHPIGAGTCGTVFEVAGSADCFKVSNLDNDWLWNDYQMHDSISKAFRSSGSLDVHVPTVNWFVNKSDDIFWSEHAKRFPEGKVNIPANLLCTERILPLPKPIREAIVDLYCPQKIRHEIKSDRNNRDCLVRLYLGKRRRAINARFFTLRNFALHLDQLEELHLDYWDFALHMADALAVMHWKAGVDANDVEFVLGSAPTATPKLPYITKKDLSKEDFKTMPPNTSTWHAHVLDFKNRVIHLWVLDFNRCAEITFDQEGIDKCVHAFFRNDPYYPRPHATRTQDQRLWAAFRERYLKTSGNFTASDLPSKFISAVVEEQRNRMERTRQTAEDRKEDDGMNQA